MVESWGVLRLPKVSSAALTTLARAGALASARLCQQKAWQGQAVKQAVAQAGNRTCVELSSARSTRTRFEPFSAAVSTSSSSRRSCRGAIVPPHALAELCFFYCLLLLSMHMHMLDVDVPMHGSMRARPRATLYGI
eukprot:scaffold16853_cov104-Isochrysis_galbana.AAC.1